MSSFQWPVLPDVSTFMRILPGLDWELVADTEDMLHARKGLTIQILKQKTNSLMQKSPPESPVLVTCLA